MLKFRILILTLILFSCKRKKSEVENIHLIYAKSIKTGLCYSMINYSNSGLNKSEATDKSTMSCIPCDSLKNVKLILIDEK